MSDGMTHDQASGELEALALGALDESERGAVLSHIAGCDACAAELAVLRTTAAALAHAVVPVSMSPTQRERVRARLLARATDDRAQSITRAARSADVVAIGAASSAVAPRRRISGQDWLALAATVIAVLSVGALARATAERSEVRAALQTAAATHGARAVALDSLERVLADRDQLIANLTGDEVTVMTIAAVDARAPYGRMFWDQKHDRFTFVGHHLPTPKLGRTYQLWLVTPTAKINAGTFAPRADGSAVVRAQHAIPKNGLAAIAVTDEPSAGSAQPTTAPFLVASAGDR